MTAIIFTVPPLFLVLLFGLQIVFMSEVLMATWLGNGDAELCSKSLQGKTGQSENVSYTEMFCRAFVSEFNFAKELQSRKIMK
jgi:hypothetical protein